MDLKRLKSFPRAYLYRLNYGPGGQATGRRPHQANAAQGTKRRDRLSVHILLFAATFISTTWAQLQPSDTIYGIVVSGLQYSCTLMAILTTHEFGHYFAAKRFGVDATLPYFIPLPLHASFGTLGAVIKTRTPIPHRRALFYIGAAGPIAGFIVSLVAVTAGIKMSQIQPVPLHEPGTMLSYGDSLLFSFIIHIFHGNIAQGSDIFLHPVAFAGWIGFLLTALNLMPVGQLDGGHILHALAGHRQRYAGWITLAVLACLSFYWAGWIVWIIIILLVVMVGHPHVNNEGEGLTTAEKATGWLCMIILVLTFVPVPVKII